MLQQKFSDDSSSFQMFDSVAYGGKNLLFKDSTTQLVPITEETYQAWLGTEYLHAVRGLDCDPTSKSQGWGVGLAWIISCSGWGPDSSLGGAPVG